MNSFYKTQPYKQLIACPAIRNYLSIRYLNLFQTRPFSRWLSLPNRQNACQSRLPQFPRQNLRFQNAIDVCRTQVYFSSVSFFKTTNSYNPLF